MKILRYLLVLLFAATCGNAQEVQNIFFDAVTFKSDSAGMARLDCYAVVPFQALKFKASGDKYFSKYTAYISIIDENERSVAEKKFERTLKADNYFNAQGGAGDFDYLAYSFNLNPAKYKVRLTVKSEYNNTEYERRRTISLIDFDSHDFTLSGVLTCSKMEENAGEYDITPYLSDNIAPIMTSFISVFETYNKLGERPMKFVAKLFNAETGEIAFCSRFFDRTIKVGTSSNYIPMQLPKNLKQGEYFLRIFAMPADCDTTDYDKQIIAGTERSVSIFRSFGNGVYEDIEKAIAQLRYVAEDDEIDEMKDAEDEDEKIRLFDEFWAKHDPTPGTDRNEAFEVYFSRVKYAEDRFSGARSRGWRSDMGHVFIVYGNPSTTDRSTPDYRGRVTETWTYANGDTFIFIDYSGFDDFRLYSPNIVSDKFSYDL